MTAKKTIKISIIFILFLFMFSCEKARVTSNIICNNDIKLWKSFASNGNLAVYCFGNNGKFFKYEIDIDSTLWRPNFFMYDDVISFPGPSGEWNIRNDTLWIDNSYFPKSFFDKVSRDTLYVSKDCMLIDFTNFFDIQKCNCDSLSAKISKEGIYFMQKIAHK